MVDDGSVGRILGHPQRVGQYASGALRAESAIENPASGLFLYIALGAYEAIAITHAPSIEGDGRKHSIAVEPMCEPLSVDAIFGRTITEERSTQLAGNLTFDFFNPVIVFGVQRSEAAAPGMAAVGKRKLRSVFW